MRHRVSLASSLVFALLAACGDDGGGNTLPTDANNNSDAPPQPDAYEPPAVNCDPLDIANAPEITLVTNQMITPNPQGGTVKAGTYELTSAKLYALGLSVTGTAQARVEIAVGNATSGAARVAVTIDASALGQMIQQDVTGAGAYTLAGTALTVADGCGGSEPLPVLNYTATDTALTLWTEYMITEPFPLTIPIELGLSLE